MSTNQVQQCSKGCCQNVLRFRNDNLKELKYLHQALSVQDPCTCSKVPPASSHHATGQPARTPFCAQFSSARALRVILHPQERLPKHIPQQVRSGLDRHDLGHTGFCSVAIQPSAGWSNGTGTTSMFESGAIYDAPALG